MGNLPALAGRIRGGKDSNRGDRGLTRANECSSRLNLTAMVSVILLESSMAASLPRRGESNPLSHCYRDGPDHPIHGYRREWCRFALRTLFDESEAFDWKSDLKANLPWTDDTQLA